MKRLLPLLLATITRHPRELVEVGVDFNWHNGNSRVWQLFRLYEVIFGRRVGIRFEGSSYLVNGTTYRTFGTWENVLVFGEHLVREYLSSWKLGFKFVPIPDFALPGGGSMPSPFRFAIAFDNSQGTSSSGTANLSCTITGSNVYLVSMAYSANTSAWTATYNSVAMTAGSTRIWVGASNPVNGNRLAGPSTGTNTLASSNVSSGIVANSYSGCAQTTEDQYILNNNSGSTTITVTFTTATTGCWGVVFAIGQNNTPTAGTGLTGRTVQASGSSLPSSFDSNGSIAGGSVGLVVNGFSSTTIGAVGYKIAALAATDTDEAFRTKLVQPLFVFQQPSSVIVTK